VDGVDASVALIGVRNTLTLGGRRETQSALATAAGASDSFNDSSRIRTHSYSVAWNYQETRSTSLTAVTSRLKSVGLDPGAPSTNQALDTVFLSTRLGQSATASIGVRRVGFESTHQSDYRENAVFGAISFRL
jgi:uncharacterized protein (PEP-CTERM system associated)